MKILTALLALIFFHISAANAQCCSAGNPTNTDFNIGVGSNTLTLGSSFKYSLSTDYFTGNESDTEYDYMDKTYFGFQAFQASYQLNQINFLALVGYFHTKNQVFNNGYEREIKGLGDLELGISYNLSHFTGNNFFFIPNAGVVLPTGAFDVVIDGIVAPIDAQPSVGALRSKGGFLIGKSWMNNKLTLVSFNIAEFSKTIESERTKSYKYGNLYMNSIAIQSNINNWLNPSVQIRSEYREKAINQDIVSNSTGGHTLFTSVKNTSQFNSLACFLSFDIPVYKNVNGTQLTNKFMISAGVNYTIKFKTLDKVSFKTDIKTTDNITSSHMKVSGACGMCKDRIEGIAGNITHIVNTDYNLANQTLTFYFNKQPDINKLAESLKAAGHDNEFGKATDEAYNNLHSCCKYQRK